MPEVTRSQLAIYAAIVVAVVLIGSRALGHAPGGDSAAAHPGTASGPAAPTAVQVSRPPARGSVVHVAGAVRDPGVYTLPAGARVKDAVGRAGGGTSVADVNAINLAAKVADGQQIVVPRRGPRGATASAAPAGTATGGTDGAGPSQPVSLNSATLDQLDTLDGVGPATAQKIVQYRAEHGGFRSVDDLGQVPGIGPKKLAALRTQVQP